MRVYNKYKVERAELIIHDNDRDKTRARNFCMRTGFTPTGTKKAVPRIMLDQIEHPSRKPGCVRVRRLNKRDFNRSLEPVPGIFILTVERRIK